MNQPPRCLLLLATISAALAVAERIPAQELESEPARYRIEVILFEHADGAATPEDPGLPELPPELPPELLSEEAAPPDPASPEEDAPLAGTEAALPFYAPAEDLALSDIADRLRRRSGYRVLLHQAWLQPGLDRASAVPVELDRLARSAGGDEPGTPADAGSLADASGQLSASAVFYRSRYLHLALDAGLAGEADSRIRERRRMRIGELHYFDAPRLGAIATVTRAQTPDAGDASP
jgi:hypothetical protein